MRTEGARGATIPGTSIRKGAVGWSSGVTVATATKAAAATTPSASASTAAPRAAMRKPTNSHHASSRTIPPSPGVIVKIAVTKIAASKAIPAGLPIQSLSRQTSKMASDAVK